MGIRRRTEGQGLSDFKNFTKKGCFLSFQREKTNFTPSSPLQKYWKISLVPPLEKMMSSVPMVFSLALSLATFVLVVVVAQVLKLFSSYLHFRFRF